MSNVKDTELTITVPKARLEAPAPSKIRVDNPDPTVGASAPADLPVSSTPSTKPRPKIDALEPNTLPAQGEDAPVKVTGSNFAGDATVTAYETKLTPTGVKTTELTITLPKDLLATPGNVNIRVVNPDSDGAASDPAELPVVVREAT